MAPPPVGAVPLSTENVVVTPGAKAALFALLKTVLRPGDEVLLPTPNWFGFAALVEQAGGTLRTLPLNPADDYSLRADRLRPALSERTRVLLLSNPNNPSGRLYRRAELAERLSVTREFPDLFVLSDEIYNLIHFAAEPAPSLLDFPDPRGRHLVVNGFSKSLALIGWGVGYLVAPAAVARACAGLGPQVYVLPEEPLLVAPTVAELCSAVAGTVVHGDASLMAPMRRTSRRTEA